MEPSTTESTASAQDGQDPRQGFSQRVAWAIAITFVGSLVAIVFLVYTPR
jgi:hypothetical protein